MGMSYALEHWRDARKVQLDELEQAHAALGGKGPGRRWRTQRINHGYAVLLASHFQGFARDLYVEAARLFANRVASTSTDLADTVEYSLTLNLQLNRGNARPEALLNDFRRLGIDLWREMARLNGATAGRRDKLEQLNAWRNAIAHQDFARLGTEDLGVQAVRSWRLACGALARDMNKVMGVHLRDLFGARPW